MKGGQVQRRAQVIAHRGASHQCQENTVQAFRRAAELGADAVEFDVRRSADGVLVVHHDPVLADGRVIVHTMSSDLPDYVPTLSAALDACEGMWVNVEIKNDPTEPDFDADDDVALRTVALLEARSDRLDRWLVSSFRRATIDAVHRASPHLPTAWLCLGLDAETAAELSNAGHSAVHPWVHVVTPELVEACHGAGLVVNTWTCDDPVRMAEVLAAGIDGVCSNVPDVARHVVDAGNTNRTASGT